MTTTTRPFRSLAPINRLGLALIGPCLLPASACAAGFSGIFDPANWIIVNTTAGLVDQILTSLGSPPVENAAFYCGNGNQVACAETIDATTGSVNVVGSIAGFNGGGIANVDRTTTWTVNNGPQPSTLMFSWALATMLPSATNQSAWYVVGTIAIQVTATDGDSGSISNITLAPFETFGLRVSTVDNIGDYGVLSITNFMATPTAGHVVPAPLPVAGVAAALSWSRHLRRRLLTLKR
jgi:hypothetical protein